MRKIQVVSLLSLYTMSLHKQLPNTAEQGKRLTRGNVWSQWWADEGDFFGQLLKVQLFIGPSCWRFTVQERARRIHFFTKSFLNTYHIADSVLGTEDTVGNSREKSLALMELLTGRKQVKQTNKQKTPTQKMSGGTQCYGGKGWVKRDGKCWMRDWLLWVRDRPLW